MIYFQELVESMSDRILWSNSELRILILRHDTFEAMFNDFSYRIIQQAYCVLLCDNVTFTVAKDRWGSLEQTTIMLNELFKINSLTIVDDRIVITDESEQVLLKLKGVI